MAPQSQLQINQMDMFRASCPSSAQRVHNDILYASKVKLWASWFCMDGGDEQALLRSLDISANLNQEVRDVEEDVVLFQNQFLTCTVILTGDGKGMQAMGGAGSKCWLCKDPKWDC